MAASNGGRMVCGSRGLVFTSTRAPLAWTQEEVFRTSFLTLFIDTQLTPHSSHTSAFCQRRRFGMLSTLSLRLPSACGRWRHITHYFVEI